MKLIKLIFPKKWEEMRKNWKKSFGFGKKKIVSETNTETKFRSQTNKKYFFLINKGQWHFWFTLWHQMWYAYIFLYFGYPWHFLTTSVHVLCVFTGSESVPWSYSQRGMLFPYSYLTALDWLRQEELQEVPPKNGYFQINHWI